MFTNILNVIKITLSEFLFGMPHILPSTGGKKSSRNGIDSDDDIEGIDNGSVYSNQSDSRSAGTADGFVDDIDETSIQLSFEDRLADNIELASQKRLVILM